MNAAAAGDRATEKALSIESNTSWLIALTALGIYTVSFGAPVIAVVSSPNGDGPFDCSAIVHLLPVAHAPIRNP